MQRDIELTVALDNKKKVNCRLRGYWLSSKAKVQRSAHEDELSVWLPSGAGLILGLDPICLGEGFNAPFTYTTQYKKI